MIFRLAPFFLLSCLQTALSAEDEESLLKNDLKHRITRDKGLRDICDGDSCKVACRLLILRQNILRAKGSTATFRSAFLVVYIKVFLCCFFGRDAVLACLPGSTKLRGTLCLRLFKHRSLIPCLPSSSSPSSSFARATMQQRIKHLDAAEGHESPSSHRQGPDFVIIGGQKAGTTALFENMLVSSRFAYPRFQTEDKKSFKEAHFFDHCLGVGTLNTHYFKKPAPDSGYWCDLQLYLDLFKNCGKKTCGDASPSYMIYPEMPLLVGFFLEGPCQIHSQHSC